MKEKCGSTGNNCSCLHAYSKLLCVGFCATNSFAAFSLRSVACKKKKKGKLAMDRLHGGGIRVVCVFADHCKTGPLWRRLPDCHSAGFSSLNKVGVSNRTCADQEIPPLFRCLMCNNTLYISVTL